MENLDRWRIFDSTDFEKFYETTSKKHFRRKFFLREVGDQKIYSQELPATTRRSRDFLKPLLKKKLFFREFKKFKNQNLFWGFQKFKNIKAKIFSTERASVSMKNSNRKKNFKNRKLFSENSKNFF